MVFGLTGAARPLLSVRERHITAIATKYDYIDANVTMLARMYGRRLRGYADMGYSISRGEGLQEG